MEIKILKIKAHEFVRRLKRYVGDQDSKYTLFLGAGCSISSEIPGAGALVKRWLPELKRIKIGDEYSCEKWIKEEFPDYSEENAALFYGPIIEELFITPDERQKEIERICGGKDPAFGYAVLAQLIGDETCGKCFNIVLTTNFDDLVADALYLYTNKKPLVVLHDSLIGFVKITRTQPLVIKLHGDARLAPKNIEFETRLDKGVLNALKSILSETGLIFIGYGGNDKSIVSMLQELPDNALPRGVYWVGENYPDGELGEWIAKRNGVWVEHKDFDELMLLIREEFEFEHPSRKRFDKLYSKYNESFESLKDKLEAKPDSPEKRILEGAFEKATKDFKDWFSVELEARKYKDSEPERADPIYQDGIKKFPNEGNLMGNYADFLKDIRKNYDLAEQYYEKAINLKPEIAMWLGSYAIFLRNIRKNYDLAEEYYKKAIDLEPKTALWSGSYADFLKDVRKNYDLAEEYYKKAIYLRPEIAVWLGSYAIFLKDIRNNYDLAEEYYKNAIDLEPKIAVWSGSYAIFLKDIRKNYGLAEKYYKNAINLEPENAAPWGNYAIFLKDIKKDYDLAEEYYKKSIDLDPKNTNNRGNFAGFLLMKGNKKDGFKYLVRALKLANEPQLVLECLFYEYAHTDNARTRKNTLSKIKIMIKEGTRSPFWNLEDNVNRAIKDGHPNPDLLKILAKVISDGIDAKELDKFDDWNKA